MGVLFVKILHDLVLSYHDHAFLKRNPLILDLNKIHLSPNPTIKQRDLLSIVLDLWKVKYNFNQYFKNLLIVSKEM